jgi:hypothetical protein
MDCWRRSYENLRLHRVRNEEILEKMDTEGTITHGIEMRLVCFGHVEGISTVTWPKRALGWIPPGRHTRGKLIHKTCENKAFKSG